MVQTTALTSTTVTLANGEALSTNNGYLSVDTDGADRVLVYIDDGTTGNTPAQYDLEHHVYKRGDIDDWLFDNEATGDTARSWSVPVSESKWRIELTNTSGAQATYRIVLEAIKE